MSNEEKKSKWERDDYYGTGAQFFPGMYTMLEDSDYDFDEIEDEEEEYGYGYDDEEE